MVDDSGPRHLALVAIAAVMALCACVQRYDNSSFPSAAMPDPGGCYALVYERPQFMGGREFINGPSKYPTLQDLPFRANWRRRIRSVLVGPTASVTIWAGQAWQGPSQILPADSRHPVLSDPLSGRVQSLEITCAR
jgi:hypothetical protein